MRAVFPDVAGRGLGCDRGIFHKIAGDEKLSPAHLLRGLSPQRLGDSLYVSRDGRGVAYYATPTIYILHFNSTLYTIPLTLTSYIKIYNKIHRHIWCWFLYCHIFL
jgi:hypothetical protein